MLHMEKDSLKWRFMGLNTGKERGTETIPVPLWKTLTERI